MAKAGKSEMAQADAPQIDPIQMLTMDHREVMKMFEQYEQIKNGEDDDLKAALVEQICASLRIHTQLEEEIFYPEVRRETSEEDMIDEAKTGSDAGGMARAGGRGDPGRFVRRRAIGRVGGARIKLSRCAGRVRDCGPIRRGGAR